VLLGQGEKGKRMLVEGQTFAEFDLVV
jgi:hypothetical protein